MTNKYFLKNGGETTTEEMVLGVKRLGYGGETTRVENAKRLGERTRGRNSLLPKQGRVDPHS